MAGFCLKLHGKYNNERILTRSSATAEITRDAETAIQGHSRSSVVPLDAAYMTFY